MPTDPTRTQADSLGDGAAPEASVPSGVSGPTAPVSGDGGPPTDPERRSWGRRIARGLLAVVAVVAFVVVGFVVYLQTNAGQSFARGIVVDQIANVFADDAEISVDGLAGSFLADARLTGFEVRRDGELVLAVDTVLVDYNLTTLLRRTFSASKLLLAGPRVLIRQRADSTFSISDLLKPADDDEQKAGFSVVLDRVAVRRGQADVVWYRTDGRDSVLAVRDLGLIVSGFRQDGDSLSGDIESLTTRLLAPFERAEVEVAASGGFTRSDLSLRSLSVLSDAGTAVDGRARLEFATDGAFPVFDATIAAAPLALSDVRAFAGVELYGDPRLRLRADSDGELLTATLTGALDDATVNIDAELAQTPNGGPVRYRAEGTLRRFDPSALTGNEALAAEVTGDLRLNLQGTTLETLSGPFRVALTESRVGQRAIDRLQLAGSFAAGRVTFDIDGALPGASLSAEGLARPFDAIPTYQIAGTAQDVDLGLLLPGSGRTDSFAGEFALLGRGKTLDTFEGELALDLTRAEIGLQDRQLRLAGAQVDADIYRGSIGFDADLALADGDGRIAALGTLDLQPLRYEITDGQATNLNLAALTGKETQDSDLTGSFTLSGEGVDLTQAPIDLTADLGPSRFGTYDFADAVLGVELRGGTAGIDAALDFGAGGQVTAQGTARPFDAPLSFDLRGTMQNLDLSVVQDNPDRVSDLTGTYVASGAGLVPAEMTLAANVQITEPSSYGARLIDAANLDVTLDAGFLTVNGTALTPEGEFDLALSGRPFDAEGPSFAFEGTCFRGLDASDFAESAPRTNLSGCFTGQIGGLADLATADASGVVTLRRSRIGDADIDDGRIAFSLVDGALTADLALTVDSPYAEPGVAAGGELAASIAGRPFDEVPTYRVTGTTRALDAGLLLDLPPDQALRLTTAFDVSGRGTDPTTLTLDGSFRAGASALGPATLDTLSTRFALANGVLRVDTLIVDSDLVAAEGAGTLALFNDVAPSDFRLEGRIESLAPLAGETERTLGLERGTFVVQARAEARGPIRIIGTAEARQVIVDDYAVTGLDASIDGTWDRAAADSLGFDALDGQLRTSFAVLSGPTFRVQEGQATIAAADGDLVIDGSVLVDDRRDLDVFARVDLETRGITLERGRFRLDDTTWQLLQPSEITLDGSLIDVRSLLLASDAGGQQIAVDGQIDLEGDQNLIVTVENVAIGGLTDFVNLDALGGDLSATLVLSGPATAPLIDGTIQLDRLTSNGETVGALDADIAYAAGRLQIDATLTHIDGETLTVDGTVPLQFSLADGPSSSETAANAEVLLTARADAFPIAWARPFLDKRAYNDLGGTLRLDLAISGTQAAPRLDGVATLSDGRLGVVKTGRTYQPILADVTFQNDRIVLDDVRILDDAGRPTLDVTGTVRLRELSVGELDLTITPSDFVAMDTRTYDGLTLDRGTTPLRLTGTLDRPVLRGSVVLAQGDIYLTDELVPPELEAVSLTDAQIREVEARFGRVVTARDTAVSRFVDALDYDLTVEIRRNVWLRSEAGLPFDIEFEGDIDARKRPFADGSRLFGRVNLIRGSVETLNRQFDVQRGSITFNGDPLAAEVDLAATLEIRLPGSLSGQSSATITLAAQGRLDDNPTIRLSSNPTMEAADIVSLIATGRLADEFVGTGALAGAGTGLLLGQASGAIEGLASEKLGLELAQIDYEGGDLVIKFGDYLSSRVFWTAGIIYPIGETGREQERLPILLSLDYELLKWLSAQTEYSGRRGIGGGLNYEVSW